MQLGRGFSVTKAQRDKVKDARCVVCLRAPCDPAHIISGALGRDDDPRIIIPLCREHHQLYDTGKLDLLAYLVPEYNDELGYAVSQYGILAVLRRVTNSRWRTE